MTQYIKLPCGGYFAKVGRLANFCCRSSLTTYLAISDEKCRRRRGKSAEKICSSKGGKSVRGQLHVINIKCN